MTNDTNDRAAFETWAVNERKLDVSRYKTGMKGYRYSAAANGWRAWQAARASTAEDAARLDWLATDDDDGRFYNIDRITAIVGIGFNGMPSLRDAIDRAMKGPTL